MHTPPSQSINLAAYEDYIGRWSRLFIPTLLNAAEVCPGDRVLDLATGPGEAAQMALSLVAASGLVVGADISRAMVVAAAKRLSSESFLPIVADGHKLSFLNGSFDAVVCQLGLQFFSNRAEGLAEARRVLKREGKIAICVLGRPESVPVWGVLADALSRYLPAEREKLHLSFALADPDLLTHLLSCAGFREVTVTRLTREGTIGSFDEYWASIRAGIGMMPQAYLALAETERLLVQQEVERRLASFKVAGKLTIPIEALIAAGRV
ncbi:MAG TPA: methyltransferase domain-containing protein [Steroidobacteraceae bacterium]|jgi:SAM-dependent methyltransferase